MSYKSKKIKYPLSEPYSNFYQLTRKELTKSTKDNQLSNDNEDIETKINSLSDNDILKEYFSFISSSNNNSNSNFLLQSTSFQNQIFLNEIDKFKYLNMNTPIFSLNEDALLPDALTCKFNSNDNILSAGFSNGTLLSFGFHNGNTLLKSKINACNNGSITSITHIQSFFNKNLILSGSSTGELSLFHTDSGKCLSSVNDLPPILSLLHKQNDCVIATGHSDRVLLHDSNTFQSLSSYGIDYIVGHKGRVNSIIESNSNEKLIISGDDTGRICIYDIRVNKIVDSFGTTCSILTDTLCSDKITGNIIVGSYNGKYNIRIYDIRSNEKEKTEIKRNIYKGRVISEGKIFSLASSIYNEKSVVGIGSCSSNHIEMFYVEDIVKNEENLQPIVSIKDIDKGVYSVCFSNNGKYLCYAGKRNNMEVVEII